ncbi:MAG: DUF4389 domain-containing protein [Actinomycetota bacterium]
MSDPMTNPAVDYPVRVDVQRPEQSSRLLALTGALLFVKALLLLPHIIVLYFLQLAQVIVAYVGYFVVLFTGRLPEGMFRFMAGVLQWYTRTSAWFLGLTDVYPPFSLAIETRPGAAPPP